MVLVLACGVVLGLVVTLLFPGEAYLSSVWFWVDVLFGGIVVGLLVRYIGVRFLGAKSAWPRR